MSEHSYNQYCPIAHALDLVGDRWALLIVRDLILGPKRFTDLKGGLPGLGTNILATRLKSLERSGVVARRALPFPAAATVYELTAYGRELGATLGALARWGGATMGPPQPGQGVSLDSVLLTVTALFRARTQASADAAYAVYFDEPSLRVTVGVRVEDGAVRMDRVAPERPDVSLWTDIATVVNVVGGRLSLREAIDRGAVRIEGDPAAVEGLIASDATTSVVA